MCMNIFSVHCLYLVNFGKFLELRASHVRFLELIPSRCLVFFLRLIENNTIDHHQQPSHLSLHYTCRTHSNYIHPFNIMHLLKDLHAISYIQFGYQFSKRPKSTYIFIDK